MFDEYLESEDIQRMDWTAKSPDLNPIEHAWDALGRAITMSQPPSRTILELKIALVKEWEGLPQLLINSLINSIKQSRKDETSFKEFSSNLLQDSMITGIPKIVSANSLQVKVLRTLFFIVCVIGFVLQTWEFMQLYWRYETVVSVTVSNPDEFELPSFTICNDHGVAGTTLGIDRFNLHQSPLRETLAGGDRTHDLLGMGPVPYQPGYLGPKIMITFPSMSIYDELYSMDFKNYSMLLQSKENFIIHSNLLLTGNVAQEVTWANLTRVMFCPNSEFPIVSSCFTFNSVIGKPNTRLATSGSNGYIFLSVDTDHIGYPPFIHEAKAQIAFHNPRQIVNPYEQGFSIKVAKDYVFRLKKIEKNLLPYPYDTNCIDYLGKWKARGGHGPTNKKECIQECYTNTTSIAYGLPKTERERCSLKKRITEEISKEIIDCQLKNCGPACFDEFYEASMDVSESREGECSVPLEYSDFKSGIHVHLGHMGKTTYNSNPKFESIEHFSNIGGYVGMWLGISLIAVFDFLSTAFSLLKFSFQNLSIKKTRVRRIKHQKRNKKIDKKEIKFWANYLKHAFRDSMLSGVPQILLAKSIFKKCALTLILLSCLVGYIYQSSEFLRLFWKYETVVDISITNSKVTELPSITICNFDGVNQTKVCGNLKPDWCESLIKKWHFADEICDCLPERYCENGIPIDRMVMDHVSYFTLRSLSPEERLKYVQDLKDVMSSCSFVVPAITRCSKTMIAVVAVMDHVSYFTLRSLPPEERLKYVQDLKDVMSSCSFVVPGKHSEDCDLSYFKKSSVPSSRTILSACFTLNTIIERPNVKPSVVPSSGTIVLNISLDESEYSYFYNPSEAKISFHNPYQFINPDIGGFTLSMKSQQHTFYLKKVVKKLLPYPYDTNCVDYISRWKERGGRGPMNNQECSSECRLNISVREFGCLDSLDKHYLMESVTCYYKTPMRKKIAKILSSKDFSQKIAECVKQNCGPACYEESYEVIRDLEAVENGASLCSF
ncbi:uncharacterized protein [Parasteatoda tepidariorum]|uniref:uncharacterized protein n=1 Tax=Parasteatoda tepidariorum TaxID=114398 RepID=UPI0039BCFB95